MKRSVTWDSELRRLEYRDPAGLHRIDLTAAGTTSHPTLSSLAWTISGHTGTANDLATFSGAGAASSMSVASLNGLLDHAALDNGSLVWQNSGHTDTADSFAGFDGSSAATTFPFPIGIGQGGTGQVTASDAFQALSPLLNPGDLIVWDGSTGQVVAFPIGADGLALTVDTTQGTRLRWQAPEPAAHLTSHEVGGSDEISIDGLSGRAATTQNVGIEKNGTLVGNRPLINFASGGGCTLTSSITAGKVTITISVP